MSFRFMKMFILGAVVGLLCLAFPGRAFGHVGSGGNCASCHTAMSGRATFSALTAPTSTAVNPRLDGGITTPLNMFTVHPGDNLALTYNVTNGGASGDSYAVVLSGTLKSSVLESLTSTTVKGIKTSVADILKFTADSGWTTQTKSSVSYFTKALSWNGTASNSTYNLAIGATAPPDVYTLTCRVAGVDSAGKWTQSQEILLNVVAVPEPSSLLLLAGLLGTVALSRRRCGA